MLAFAKSGYRARSMGLSSSHFDSSGDTDRPRPWRALVGLALCAAALTLSLGPAHAQTITRIAGNGAAGAAVNGGQALNSAVEGPFAVAVEPNGDILISQGFFEPGQVRRIIAATGVMQGVASSGGPVNNLGPSQIALDAVGNIYFADPTNHRIARVDRTTGALTTLAGAIGQAGAADGPVANARFNTPNGLAFDRAGGLIVGDTQNHTVRRIDLVANTVTTLAGVAGSQGFQGDGAPALAARLTRPHHLAVDAAGRVVFIDGGNRRIRRFLPGGTIETLAGNGAAGFAGDNGPALAATLANGVLGLTIDGSGRIFISDHENHRVRAFAPGGNITTVAGNGTDGTGGDNGPAATAQVGFPAGLWIDAAGNLLIAQPVSNLVRRVGAVAALPVPPDTAYSIPAPGALPPAAVTTTVTGTTESLTIRVTLDFSQLPQFESAPGRASTPTATTTAAPPRPPFQVYLMALVPGRLLQVVQPVLFLQDSQNRWGPVANPVQAYARNVDPATLNQNRLVVTILENFNSSLLPGTEFYLGYGSDATEMAASGRFRGVYKVQP